MNEKLKKLLNLVVLIMLMFLIAGCGKKQDVDLERSTSKDQREKTPITLTFKGYFNEENAEAAAVAFHQIKADFLAENKHITFDDENLAHDAYDQKIKALFAANEIPDIYQLKADWIDSFNQGGNLLPLNDILDDEWLASFNQGALAEFTRDGVIYGLPYRIDTVNNLFYNREIFKECGITSFPKTMEEFEHALLAIKEKGYIPFAAGNKGGWFADIAIFRGFLDRYAGSDWSKSLTNKTGAKFTDPEFVAALSQLNKLIDMDIFNEDINSLDFLQFKKYYYEGKAAMFMDGSGGILPFVEECPVDLLEKTEVTVLPMVEGGKSTGVPGAAGWSLTINKDLKGAKKEAAIEFLRRFTSPDAARIIAENSGNPAVSVDEYDRSALSTLMVKYNTMMSETELTSLFTVAPETVAILWDGIQEMMFDLTTPEELAEKLQEAYESE